MSNIMDSKKDLGKLLNDSRLMDNIEDAQIDTPGHINYTMI